MKVIKKISFKQKGATLILAAFIIALAATVYVLKAYDPAQLRLEQDKKTYLALNEAKQALISWAVSNSVNPGQMPFPDRNADGNYDGRSDCPSPVSAFSHSFLIGQLPLYGQTNPCISPQAGLGINTKDGGGNPLFYAVSRNLVHKYDAPTGNPIINPSIISSPTYPWLKVLDANGVPFSNRVAAVIIAPKDAIGSQDRTGVANIINYLDTFLIGSATFSNSDYDSNDEDFVINRNSMDVNDKLVYVTIDELIDSLNSRASSDGANLLNQYRTKNGQFPYAANLGSALNNHDSSGVITKGMIPIDVTDTCGCASSTSCSCSFNPILNVEFKKDIGLAWTSDAGSCKRLAASCTCTGAGSCNQAAEMFSCDANGLCANNVAGSYIYSVPIYADIYSASLGCDITGTQAVCDNAGTFEIGLKEPNWFKINLWQDYIYYEWSATNSLQLGGRVSLAAILINTGQTNLGQDRTLPTNNTLIQNYLDSVENTDGNNIFEASNKHKDSNYNDQPFIVAP